MVKRFRKKAQVIDLIYFLGILFLIAVIGIITLFVVSSVRQQFEDDDLISPENIQMIQNYEDRLPNMSDHLFIVVLVGISIVTLVSALFVVSHPVFYGLMIIVLSFITWLSAIYANVYQEFATHPDWAIHADKLVLTSHVLRYFPLTMIVLSIIIVVVMVAKK